VHNWVALWKTATFSFYGGFSLAVFKRKAGKVLSAIISDLNKVRNSQKLTCDDLLPMFAIEFDAIFYTCRPILIGFREHSIFELQIKTRSH